MVNDVAGVRPAAGVQGKHDDCLGRAQRWQWVDIDDLTLLLAASVEAQLLETGGSCREPSREERRMT